MKKKMYEKPTMEVVECEQEVELLAGSNGQAGVQDYNWNDYDEE